ncbi:restriction endonuclease subunit S [Enterobacter cloacae]|uniref:restriction endonuclease subunit S n=1 Tax=Enterobacter cloacae TaxID=550 RepID=UPI0028E90013|nr:restriction endonuclease subunit S [Enterobacter cloacae]HDR2789142.1 restriction endonuclease subunit S [Enterobacter asburiae]WNT37352.1 restriction endonuclease subunit S [Enterobacter cloacae]HDR2791407.1 restriction endonuclease subunit S [Enterobacter asburiae]HDR2796165.1 restriction endonuclease subunit S [Enterobacter asburiae]HDR2801567.1 restriction endonuclease subunit S [Enterobacter asburiae]
MNFEFERVSVSDVCELIVDCVNKTAPKVEHETQFKMIRTPNIRNGVINLDGCNSVSEETYIKWTRRATVEKDDVLLTREAPMGEVGIIDFEDTVFLGQRIMQYRANKSKLCPKFLLYSFLSSDLKNQFYQHEGSGSVVSHIRVPDCLKFEINLPPLKTQIKISSFLWGIDQKIKNNNKMNQTLEQMAQALFKSWFVDFEPVKAKMAVLEAGGSQEDATRAAMTAISGKDADALAVFEHEHPKKYAELKATAELFPSAMRESELGEIPEGWTLGSLSDIATFANGKVNVSSLTPDTYISTENMLENRAGISTASSLPSVNSVPDFRRGHVLISNIRPYFTKIWLARFEGGRSADVLAFEARDSVTVEYIYNLLYQESFFDFMMLTSKGVKMPRGDKKAIMGWQCICPEKKISHAFSKAVSNYYSFIESNNAQNKTLTQLRDTLLPKLLSGEITLPEAERAVSEAENV